MNTRGRWLTIGIVGGLGPFAHIEFERCLLAAAPGLADQDFPPWLLSSMPGTPDRTACLLGEGPSPVPALRASLRRLAGAAFAVIPCNTAHAFLDALTGPGLPPVLSIVDAAIERAAAQVGPRGRVGLMGTTGTLGCGLYPQRAAVVAPGLRFVSLLDLPGGAAAHEETTMRPIYGPLGAGGRLGGGIKAGGRVDRLSGRPHDEALAAGVARLGAAGAGVVLTACTEIPLALGRAPVGGVALVDPLMVAAEAAVAVAAGRRALPGYSFSLGSGGGAMPGGRSGGSSAVDWPGNGSGAISKTAGP